MLLDQHELSLHGQYEPFIFIVVVPSFGYEHPYESLNYHYVLPHGLKEFAQPNHFKVALNSSSCLVHLLYSLSHDITSCPSLNSNCIFSNFFLTTCFFNHYDFRFLLSSTFVSPPKLLYFGCVFAQYLDPCLVYRYLKHLLYVSHLSCLLLLDETSNPSLDLYNRFPQSITLINRISSFYIFLYYFGCLKIFSKYVPLKASFFSER